MLPYYGVERDLGDAPEWMDDITELMQLSGLSRNSINKLYERREC
ncbi:hypothetical protein PAECIP111893_02997 [Paenibacillus plantiphilus]|uniref:Uncharacterized protein n=1 Tax=Paenibacillus plantiphilus TaxID=2905650 RepID=A0ABM9CD22_9BACL|nr:hypothetical protein PAECIP111893_02997 [Paenibacillus plantiphilus]